MTTTNKILTGGAIAGAIITGAIIADKTTDYAKYDKPKIEIQRQKEVISHSEFMRRIDQYNGKILEVSKKGIKFELHNINANNTIIDRLNDSIK